MNIDELNKHKDEYIAESLHQLSPREIVGECITTIAEEHRMFVLKKLMDSIIGDFCVYLENVSKTESILIFDLEVDSVEALPCQCSNCNARFMMGRNSIQCIEYCPMCGSRVTVVRLGGVECDDDIDDDDDDWGIIDDVMYDHINDELCAEEGFEDWDAFEDLMDTD